MCKWLTVNEALDLILDRGPGEDENIKPEEEEAVEEEEEACWNNPEHDPDHRESTDEESHGSMRSIIMSRFSRENTKHFPLFFISCDSRPNN